MNDSQVHWSKRLHEPDKHVASPHLTLILPMISFNVILAQWIWCWNDDSIATRRSVSAISSLDCCLIRDGYWKRKLNIDQSKRVKCQNVMDRVKSSIVRSLSRSRIIYLMISGRKQDIRFVLLWFSILQREMYWTVCGFWSTT